jgi:hypothetical protein
VTADELHDWLESNHATAAELVADSGNGVRIKLLRRNPEG